MCTSKQRRFVEEYLVDLNGTQAAIRAGYSPRTANEQASQLLAKLSVQEEIAKAQEERSKRSEITADSVLKEYAKIAFANIKDFAYWSGQGVSLYDSTGIPDEKLAAVESVSEGKDGIKFKMHSKLGALDALARHLGLDKLDGLVSKMLEEELDAIIAGEKGEGGESEEDS